MEKHETPQIDFASLALKFAVASKIDCDAMEAYPGYDRQEWREKAERLAKLYTKSI